MYSTEWLHQTDYRLPKKFNRYGCFVRAIAQGAEDFFETALDVDGMKRLIKRSKKEGAINGKMYLQNSDSHQHVLNIVLDMLGEWKDGWRGAYVGKKEPRYIYDARRDEDYVFYVDEYNVKGAAHHFLRAHATGGIRWNSMPSLNLGECVSRRVFVIHREDRDG